jgi:hypothetical protein
VIEEPLGGNQSASVRVGDTVRRRASPWTLAVHALLRHLHASGFDAVPEPLGVDDKGRAVLRYMPGQTHPGWPDPMPRWMNEDDATITAAGALLRRYHAVADSFIAPPEARWRTVAPGRHEIICHYDWAPYNALFRGHEPVVMLDWDSAGPGTRLWDVALAAYQWVPLFPILDGVSHNRVLPLPQRAARLATFCEGYGGVRPVEAIDALIEELPFHAELIQRLADEGDLGSVKLAGWNVPQRLRRESELLRRERSSLVGT